MPVMLQFLNLRPTLWTNLDTCLIHCVPRTCEESDRLEPLDRLQQVCRIACEEEQILIRRSEMYLVEWMLWKPSEIEHGAIHRVVGGRGILSQ